MVRGGLDGKSGAGVVRGGWDGKRGVLDGKSGTRW